MLILQRLKLSARLQDQEKTNYFHKALIISNLKLSASFHRQK
jgi:hypothetical protein